MKMNEHEGVRLLKGEIAYKGFESVDGVLKCLDMVYELGKTYTLSGELELYKNGFHFCWNLNDLNEFYTSSVICEVEILGDVLGAKHPESVTNKLKVLRVLTSEEIHKLSNTGSGNIGFMNAGYCNAGDANTGSYNSFSYNTGDYNAGYHNAGSRNTGHWNVGNGNSGSWNVGHQNSGNENTGSWNSGDHNMGLFNSTEPFLRIFNIETKLLYNDVVHEEWFKNIFRYPLELTEWLCAEEELKEYEYEEACAKWWSRYTDEEKELFKTIPNFDPDVFFEITGIRIITND